MLSAIPTSGYLEVDSPDVLRELLGEPHPLVIDKVHERLSGDDLDVLANSTFCLLATSDAAGEIDVSPRGGDPGFVRVLDGRTLALPERPGNRRGDSLHNVLQNPHVGMLHLIRGDRRILRINGRARILRDAPFFPEMAVTGVPPALAVLVEIDEVYAHCPASLKHADLWPTAPARG